MISRRLLPLLFLLALNVRGAAEPGAGQVDLVISVSEQRMVVLQDGGFLKKYKVSTSRFGVGDSHGSYKTPLGRLRVWEKVGGELPSGAVLKGREATGEILPANAPGRDPIVSRILWLEGLEPQNDNARGRGIYIHGTTEESHIGKPVSWGCIRMRSEDVMELYDLVGVGALVTITEEGMPRFAKWKPAPTPVFIASQTAAKVLPERISPVAELSRPAAGRMVRADAGAADAFRGSILFAGLPAAPKAVAKKPVKAAPVAVAEELPQIDLLTSGARGAVQGDAFSLEVRSAMPPMALIDLRRVALSPLVENAGILDAPNPAAASDAGAERETTMSAVIRPGRSSVH